MLLLNQTMELWQIYKKPYYQIQLQTNNNNLVALIKNTIYDLMSKKKRFSIMYSLQLYLKLIFSAIRNDLKYKK